ncbi:hypothetical protein OIK40_07390 [Erythrobacter sp. sf7]|uniref:DUF3040 domain-containing protein n=1 Tax=Erythrobacter fulvus TaxID=2987523 RepID=A0ABT5JNV6_9SPHN|nr:hypothetical protein [Erythrobacter fulvus]MDC8754460.1 hypothetical protein [Erythrobacter fulvus]
MMPEPPRPDSEAELDRLLLSEFAASDDRLADLAQDDFVERLILTIERRRKRKAALQDVAMVAACLASATIALLLLPRALRGLEGAKEGFLNAARQDLSLIAGPDGVYATVLVIVALLIVATRSALAR